MIEKVNLNVYYRGFQPGSRNPLGGSPHFRGLAGNYMQYSNFCIISLFENLAVKL